MTATLAISDGWIIGSFIVQMIVNIGLAIGLFWLKTNAGDKRALQADIKKTAAELVEAKHSALAGELRQSIQSLTHEISQLNRRLNDSEKKIDAARDRDHGQDIKVLQAINEMQNWMNDKFATKEDIRQLNKRLDTLPCANCSPAGDN